MMKCFAHNEIDAVGICKACSKAICASCTIDTGRGIACSDTCSLEVDQQNQIIDKSKKIYSIGEKAPFMPTGLIVYFFFGIIFTGVSIFNFFHRGSIEWLSLLMGIGFIIIGLIAWHKNKHLNLNC